MPKRLLFVACLLIVPALVLSACGGGSGGGSSTGGGSGSSGPEAEIESAVQESATASDPANCTKLDTQKFVEQMTHEKGPGAVKACEGEAGSGGGAHSVSVSNVKANGSQATLEATFDGSIFDGQTIAVAMVKEGSQWKVDQVTKIVKLDKAALQETFKTQLEATGELSGEQVSCITDGIGKASQTGVEELLLSSSAQPFIDLATKCA